MNERITFVCPLENKNLQKIEKYTNKINGKLCKVPFGKNVDNREEVDTLPYHFTLIYWDVESEKKVIEELSNIKLPKLKVFVDGVQIIKGSEDSYELFFNITTTEELKELQQFIYNVLPSRIYNPSHRNFHISIHADKDYNKIILMKERIIEDFVPFELEIDTYGLYRIYPAKLVKQFKTIIDDKGYEE